MISEDKCPKCGVRAITISGFDFECGSSQYVNGINRSFICYENQLYQQAQEIERLRKELSLYKAVWDEVRMADRAQILEYTEAGRELKDLGEI